MIRTTETRDRNRAKIAQWAEGSHLWRRRLRWADHILDRWAALDASYELRAIHLARWTRPETQAAIDAAQAACEAAQRAMADETEERGMW